MDSLEDRRAANPGFGKIEPGLRNDLLFLQKTDRYELRSNVAGGEARAGGVCDQTKGARTRVFLAGMDVGGLNRSRPQHQGQAEPRRASEPGPHVDRIQLPALELDSSELITVIRPKTIVGKLL